MGASLFTSRDRRCWRKCFFVFKETTYYPVIFANIFQKRFKMLHYKSGGFQKYRIFIHFIRIGEPIVLSPTLKTSLTFGFERQKKWRSVTDFGLIPLPLVCYKSRVLHNVCAIHCPHTSRQCGLAVIYNTHGEVFKKFIAFLCLLYAQHNTYSFVAETHTAWTGKYFMFYYEFSA